MNYGSILIVTYGRSGSTLLQGVLNSIEGVRVIGENFEFCFHLYQTWKSLARAKQKTDYPHNKNTPQNPWYGANELQPERFLSGIMPLVREQLMGAQCHADQKVVYGFKEIRYINHLDELDEYLDFLCRILPNPAFIFNIRTHADVMRSGWWKHTNPIKTKATLEKADQAFSAYSEQHSNAFLIRYEDVVKGYDGLQPLMQFLGAEVDENELSKTLGTIHSYDVSENTRRLHLSSDNTSDTPKHRVTATLRQFMESLSRRSRKGASMDD